MYLNLIKDLEILCLNQIWVEDITYWLIKAGYLYIFLLTDAYSRRIMEIAIADNLESINSRVALEMDLKYNYLICQTVLLE